MFKRLALDRQERYIYPLTEKIIMITRQQKEQIADLITTRKLEKSSAEMSALPKMCLFLGSAILINVGMAVFQFVTVVQKVFINVLVGWKGMNLGNLDIMFSRFTQLLERLTFTLHIPDDLMNALMYPFYLLYQLTNVVNINFIYKLLTVTCEGAKSPIELFIISLALGVAILFVESHYGILWSVSLQDMNQAIFVNYWIKGKKILSFNFVSSLVALLLTSANPFVTILRFFLSYFTIGAFFANDHVSHNISVACLNIAGFQDQEILLVACTSVLVWLLIAPMLYIVAEVVCPKGGYTITRFEIPIGYPSAFINRMPLDNTKDAENSPESKLGDQELQGEENEDVRNSDYEISSISTFNTLASSICSSDATSNIYCDEMKSSDIYENLKNVSSRDNQSLSSIDVSKMSSENILSCVLKNVNNSASEIGSRESVDDCKRISFSGINDVVMNYKQANNRSSSSVDNIQRSFLSRSDMRINRKISKLDTTSRSSANDSMKSSQQCDSKCSSGIFHSLRHNYQTINDSRRSTHDRFRSSYRDDSSHSSVYDSIVPSLTDSNLQNSTKDCVRSSHGEDSSRSSVYNSVKTESSRSSVYNSAKTESSRSSVYDSVKSSRKDDSSRSSAYDSVSDSQADNSSNNDSAYDSVQSSSSANTNIAPTSSALMGVWLYVWSYISLIFSVDLSLMYSIIAWVTYCEKNNHCEQLLQLRSNQRWNQQAFEESIRKFRNEHVHTDVLTRNIKFFHDLEKSSRDANERIEKKWQEVVVQPDSVGLPPYYRLCVMEQQELQELLSRSSAPLLLRSCITVFSYSAIIASFGHVLTAVGRKNWTAVMRKYFLFACICVGIWTDESYEAYELELLPKLFAESDPNEVTILFVSLIISFRAILLQALGVTTSLASIVIISMSPAPLFVFSPKMQARIPPLIYWNCRKIALEREEKENNSVNREGMSEEWVIKLRSLSIFLTESRVLVFLANVVPLYLTIALLEGFDISNGYLSILGVALVPYFVGSTLLPIIYIGKRLNLSDKDFQALWLGWIVQAKQRQPKVYPIITILDGNSFDEDDVSLPSSIFDCKDETEDHDIDGDESSVEISSASDDDFDIAQSVLSESDTDPDDQNNDGRNGFANVYLSDGNEEIDADSITVYVSSESDVDHNAIGIETESISVYLSSESDVD